MILGGSSKEPKIAQTRDCDVGSFSELSPNPGYMPFLQALSDAAPIMPWLWGVNTEKSPGLQLG